MVFPNSKYLRAHAGMDTHGHAGTDACTRKHTHVGLLTQYAHAGIHMQAYTCRHTHADTHAGIHMQVCSIRMHTQRYTWKHGHAGKPMQCAYAGIHNTQDAVSTRSVHLQTCTCRHAHAGTRMKACSPVWALGTLVREYPKTFGGVYAT